MGSPDEGMGANQLCRIVVGISSQIGRDGHRDMGDVSTYGKSIRNLLGSMKPPGSNLCADTRRYKYLRASQGVKAERDLHWVERGLTFEFLAAILESRSWIIVECKIVHPRKNSCHSWSQLSSDNGEIGSWSRLYQPEAFGPSGPGLGLSTRNDLFFFLFPSAPIPSPWPTLGHFWLKLWCYAFLCNILLKKLFFELLGQNPHIS